MSCPGCHDTALPLTNCNDGCADCQPTNAVGLPDCPPNSEPCEEVAESSCVKYTGPNLPVLGILNGMRLKTALAKMTYELTSPRVFKTYDITVSSVQTTTTVEYINKSGELATKTVKLADSPQSICALEGTPAKTKGTGTITATTTIC